MNEIIIYRALLYGVFLISPIVFVMLFFVSAPYGRFLRKGWGKGISSYLAWFIMELPAVLVILFLYILSERKSNPVLLIFLGLWMLHYLQRTFIYPFLMRARRRNFPLVIVLFSIIFNVLNGYLNGRYLFFFSEIDKYSLGWLFDPRFIAGVTVFLVGFYINVSSDTTLRNLRKPGEASYKIPQKGLFKYISSPNYFGEILEWFGWALATWSMAGLAFAVFTTANLLPRAVATHRWYKDHFVDYPDDRKAIIPFLY